MRVLAVAQALGESPAERPEGRRRLADGVGEPVGDRRVVGRRAGEGLLGQAPAQGRGHRAPVGVEVGEHRPVIARIDHDRHVGVVLRGRPDHGRAADVDLLHAVARTRRPPPTAASNG